MTNSTKYTPGPWERIAQSGTQYVQGPEGDCIAVCDGIVSPNLDNARLIAAAPDLLEACKQLLNSYASKADYSKPDELHSSVRRAHEAINKAEGR